MLTADRVRSLLDYNRDTGVLTWRVPRGRQKKGSIAGRLHHCGYREVVVDKVLHREHRIIWLWMTGSWPEAECEHINHQRADNRFTNLRAATRSENMQNLSRGSNNTSGIMGASFHKVRGKWRATINIDGKARHLGHFDTAEEAGEAYMSKKRQIYPFFFDAMSK